MAHLTLYRKYRPKNTKEMVGQEDVIKTLLNQIRTGKIAHAYLFSGSRGTGKTTTAKIFARAINCLNPVDGNPCNECEVCKSILEERNVDVIEIDAASNNSVDDIRELKENVKYPPSINKYKVYIIDEVHMLSTSAFNALLKTLEEPPKHVVFILATTEPHKLLPTIISRCQRYDFKRIPIPDITKRLKFVCEQEGIEIEDDALKLIAQKAFGGMRDALSILETISSSYPNEKISYEKTLKILGLLEEDVLLNIAESILKNDIRNILKNVEEIYYSGKSIVNFFHQLIKFYRDILVVKTTNSLEFLEISKKGKEKIKVLAEQYNEQQLIFIINTLSKELATVKNTTNPKIVLETVLLTIAQPILNSNIESLILEIKLLKEKIEKLEKDSFNKEKQPEKTKNNEKANVKENNIKLYYYEAVKLLIQNNIMDLATFCKKGEPLKYENDKFILGFKTDEDINTINNRIPKTLKKSTYKTVLERALKKIFDNKNLILEIIKIK